MSKLILILFLFTANILAVDNIEQTDYCSINWTKGEIICSGESAEGQKKFRAKRSAIIVAQRNLLELIKGLKIDSQTTVENGMLKSDIINSSVTGMIKSAQVISNEFNEQYRSSVATLRVHIGTDLRNALKSDKDLSNWNDKIDKFSHSFILE
jgi:hypothetical protein